jgi:hypothetical protein
MKKMDSIFGLVVFCSFLFTCSAGSFANPLDGKAEGLAAPGNSPGVDRFFSSTTSTIVIEADLFVDDDNTTGTENGDSQYPYNTIQEAIDTAAGSGETTIVVAGGTYNENIQVEDKTILLFGGFAGGSTTDYTNGDGGDFDDRDPSAYQSHIKGDGTDSVVTLIKTGSGRIDGFRITGGTGKLSGVPGGEWWRYDGGGIYCYGGSPTISNNIIEDNDTRHLESATSDNFGGGIWATDHYNEDQHVSIIDNLVRNNFSGRGAGMSIQSTSALIRGNTVEGNIGKGDHGGGIYIYSPDATISYNLVQENETGRDLGYGWGGGIVVYGIGTSVSLSYNVVTGNYAPSNGTGVFIDDGAEAVLDHEMIYANDCTADAGAGLYVDGGTDEQSNPVASKATLKNCIVVNHNCSSSPGSNGLDVEGLSEVTIANSIFWGNNADDFWVDSSSILTVAYTTSQETIAGTGNVSTADPLFADFTNHDYHLQSSAGRWDPSANDGSGGWVIDTQDSPAIDAGDPTSDYSNEPSANGDRCNMGVYGNTSEASKSEELSGSTTTTTSSSTTTTTGACPSEALYGERSEETGLLRYFRDNILNQTPEGQEIIRLYYQWSPEIVQAMEEDEEFKEELKGMVDGVLELVTK